MTGIDASIYRRLVESSPDGVALVDALDPERPVIYVNRGFEALTGYSSAELLGRNLRLLQGDDREQDGRHRLREALGKGESCRVLLRNYRKDGTVFWNEMTVAPLLDADGRITHFAGHHRDAGERLRIDPKLTRDSLSGAHQPTAVAIRDDRLTGLFTLPYLEELLKRDWAVAQREKRSIAVFAIDIDALDLYNTTFGRAAETARISVDLPALGRPRRPTSAISFSSSSRDRLSPGSPGPNCRGERLVLDLNRVLPHPPLPPRTTSNSSPSRVRSPRAS